MFLTELVAIGAMLGSFGLIPLILLLLKTKPMPVQPMVEVSPVLPQKSVPHLLDYRRITLPMKER